MKAKVSPAEPSDRQHAAADVAVGGGVSGSRLGHVAGATSRSGATGRLMKKM